MLKRPKPAYRLVKDPSIKAYMHQKGSELGQFVTPQTEVVWLSEDLFKQSTNEYGYRIELVLREGEAQIRQAGVSKDIYSAIDRAQRKMLEKLLKIQEQVLSQEDRMNQIQAALTTQIVH